MTIQWKARQDIEQYFTVVLFVFQFYPVLINFIQSLSILDLALSGVQRYQPHSCDDPT